MSNDYTGNIFDNFEKVNLVAAPLLLLGTLFLLLLNTTRSLFAIGLMTTIGLSDAQLVYFFSSILVMLLSLYGLYSQHHLIIPNNLRKLFYLNLLIYISWVIPELIAGRSNVTHFISLGLLPFSIFIFMLVPSYLFKRLILLILLIASMVTIYDFILANNPLTNTYRENIRLFIDPGV